MTNDQREGSELVGAMFDLTSVLGDKGDDSAWKQTDSGLYFPAGPSQSLVSVDSRIVIPAVSFAEVNAGVGELYVIGSSIVTAEDPSLGSEHTHPVTRTKYHGE